MSKKRRPRQARYSAIHIVRSMREVQALIDEYERERDFPDMNMLVGLVACSDFRKLSYDEEFAIVRSLPIYIRNEFDEKGRTVLGIYELAGDDSSAMYFFHTWSPRYKACAAAFMLDFRKATDIAKPYRDWYCINPEIPVVSSMLYVCSEMAHDAEGESKGHPIEG